GLEEFDNQERRRLPPSSPQDQDKGEEEEEDQGLDEGGRLESFGDVVQHVRAAGSRRKLLSLKVGEGSGPQAVQADEGGARRRCLQESGDAQTGARPPPKEGQEGCAADGAGGESGWISRWRTEAEDETPSQGLSPQGRRPSSGSTPRAPRVPPQAGRQED
ncbi:unnamed protein product, partial [Ectocarpus sp. 12 AP-2014]